MLLTRFFGKRSILEGVDGGRKDEWVVHAMGKLELAVRRRCGKLCGVKVSERDYQVHKKHTL